MAEEYLHGAEISGALVDQRRLSAPQRVGAVEARIKPDARYPLRQQASILSCCQASPSASSAKQWLTRLSARKLQVVFERLPGLFGEFELDRAARFLLADSCPVKRAASRGNVLDPDGDHIAAPQLAVDCQVEEGQVTFAAFQK